MGLRHPRGGRSCFRSATRLGSDWPDDLLCAERKAPASAQQQSRRSAWARSLRLVRGGRDRVAGPTLAFRAMEVARSVKQGSRRGGKAGVRIRDPKQLFCIHPAMEAFAEEQLSVVLLVRSDRDADTDGHFCIPLVKRKGSGHGRRRRPWQGYGPCATIGRGGAARVVQRDARWWIRCSRSGSGRAMAGPLGRTR